MEKYITHRYQKIALRCIVLIAFISTFVRIFFGVEFTDESQYASQIVGPLLGGELFITDRLFQQSGSILATPFAYLYIQLTGSTVGIVLFLRFLFYAVSVTTALLLTKTLSKKISFDAALAISAISILYIPYNVPSVSYNSMAVLLSTLTLMLARTLSEKRSHFVGVLLAITASLGVFSYPPLALGYLILFLYYFKTKALRANLIHSLIWTVVITTALLIPVFNIGTIELKKNFAIAQLVSLLTFNDKINISAHYLTEIAPSLPILCIIFFAILLFRRKPFELISLPILAVYYAFVASFTFVDLGAGFIIFSVSLSILFLFVKNLQLRNLKSINIDITVAVTIGLIAGLTSSNGMLNAAMGFSIALLFIFESYIIRNSKFPWISWLATLSLLCISQWTFFYRESSIKQLTHQVESGPYAGLFTSKIKKSILYEIENDLSKIPKSAKSIFSYDSFPAGYLFTDLKPITFMYYMHPASMAPKLRPILVDMFSIDSNLPDVVLEMTSVPVTEVTAFLTKDLSNNLYNDPFWNYFKNNSSYRIFIQKNNYTIYIKNNL